MSLLQEIDVRGLPVDRRVAFARRALSALRPGDSVVLLSDDDPQPLLERLRSPETQDVEVCSLTEGGGLSSVELWRHRGRRSLLEVLRFEHERLEKLIADLEWRLAQQREHAAEERFARFRAALEHHLELEERVLFPGLVRVLGSGERISELEAEHATMRAILNRVSLGLHRTDEDLQGAICAISDLRELLAPHAEREEIELCAALPQEEAARLAEQLHGMHPL
jgi:hemerythrin-like domain-containing protein